MKELHVQVTGLVNHLRTLRDRFNAIFDVAKTDNDLLVADSTAEIGVSWQDGDTWMSTVNPWHSHVMSTDGANRIIPTNHCVVVSDFTVEAAYTLTIQGTGVLQVIG